MYNDITDRIHRAKRNAMVKKIEVAFRLFMAATLVYATTVLAIIAFGG